MIARGLLPSHEGTKIIAQCVVTDFICAQIQLNHWIDLTKMLHASIDFVYHVWASNKSTNLMVSVVILQVME